MSVNIDLKDETWSGINKIRVPLDGGGTQDFSIGGGSVNLQTKSKTYTPTESQQTEQITADNGYDGLQKVDVTVNAISSTYVGTGVTRKGSTTYTPTSSDQTISGSTYLTGTQTIEGIVCSNLTASNIKKDVVVKIGTATDDDSVTTVTGTYSGGASNFVTGTFTTPSTAGAVAVGIPYTGSGYPVMCVVVIEGGAYNNTSTGDTNWYNSVQRYAVGQWTMTKSVMTSTPTYGTSGTANQGVTTWIYKNSTSTATTYARSSAMTTNVFSSNNASNSGANTIKLKTGNILSYYTNTSSYGLLPSTTYRYYIVYSS